MQEPELPEVDTDDRPVVRNVIYCVWGMNINTGNSCIGWLVSRVKVPSPRFFPHRMLVVGSGPCSDDLC